MVPGISRRLILFGLGLALVAVTAWSIWNQFADSSPSVQMVYTNLDVAVEDLHLIQGGEGQRTWELKARQSRYVRDASRLEFDRPRIDFYKDEDSSPIHAQAPSGEYLQDKGVARLWPRVKASFGQNTVHAERMVFDRNRQSLVFQGHVVIDHPQARARSNKARIDLEKNQLVLTGDVEVDFHETIIQ